MSLLYILKCIDVTPRNTPKWTETHLSTQTEAMCIVIFQQMETFKFSLHSLLLHALCWQVHKAASSVSAEMQQTETNTQKLLHILFILK